ncbi:MAG: hydroxyacid dehydrogenase [Thermoplasmata archaeon]|nr:hydroxyacid dehydrogenase [Thermoplasmata archaeon]MCI4340834.1 hydroxyacid dehydrogenase [Thermoplasmata archaeon]
MPASLPLVLIADPIDPAAAQQLAGGSCRVVDASAGGPALEPYLGEAWALVVRSRTKVTSELLARAPQLRIIARAGVGVDNVDLAEASRRRIRVVNAPTAATQSVAELTVALMLLLVRGLYPSIAATKGGSWNRGTHGHELAGRTVGFVGYGRIARETRSRLRNFGVTVLAHDPFLASSPDGTVLLPLPELLARSEIVSLHAALTEQNRHLMNADRIGRMPRGSYLLNVARGALVDEEALLAALDSGHLGGAALDVFEVEPPTRTALLQHPRVIPTPHLGASTVEAQARAGVHVAEELLRALRQEPLLYQVNPEVSA